MKRWVLLLQDGFMPEFASSICNDTKFTADRADCQGFVYDSKQKIAFFKPKPAVRLLDTGDLCSSPTTYTWLRTLGQLHGIYNCPDLHKCNCSCCGKCMACLVKSRVATPLAALGLFTLMLLCMIANCIIPLNLARMPKTDFV